MMRSYSVLMVILFACEGALGQSFTYDPADGIMPPAMKPEAPAGSYALSGFEGVNLYSGKVNQHSDFASRWARRIWLHNSRRPLPPNFTVEVSRSIKVRSLAGNGGIPQHHQGL